MESSNFRNAIGVVKDQTSITLAKIASYSDLRVAIVKATGHKACPAKEHHIREILLLTSYSHCYAVSCVAAISRRLSKTKDWVVALKALILSQRLIQEGNPTFDQEILCTTKNGTHILDMSYFRDLAWANSWDFSAFVRSYSLYLREQLDSKMQEKVARCGVSSYAEDEDRSLSPGSIIVRTSPVQGMQNMQIYLRTKWLIKHLDSFLACQPTGAAKNSRIVAIALYPIVKQSFDLYYEISEIVSILQDRFYELDVAEYMQAFDILCRVAKQYEELHTFYDWCIDACISRTSDYPEVHKIPQEKLELMDDFIKRKIKLGQREPEPELESESESEHETEPIPEGEPKPTPDLISIEPLPTTEVFQEEKEHINIQDIGDLLSFEDDVPTTHEHSDQMALALFGKKPETQPWQPFIEFNDWETTLVQTASLLSKQQPSLPSGFDTLLLDGMYQQGALINTNMINTGSASSVAFGSHGSPGMLALPAPTSENGTSLSGDPFEASRTVALPSYVQMSDIETKQRLLMEEQMMWHQYQYQGQVGMGNMCMNQYPYNMTGYTYQY